MPRGSGIYEKRFGGFSGFSGSFVLAPKYASRHHSTIVLVVNKKELDAEWPFRMPWHQLGVNPLNPPNRFS
jgi:hypothetical protein